MNHRPQHQLNADYRDGEAVLACPECAYSFRAPADEYRIQLGERSWIDRGNRDAVHVYMKSPADVEVMMLERWFENS